MNIFEIYCTPKNSKEWKPIMYYMGDVRNFVARRNRRPICFVQKSPLLAVIDANEEDYHAEGKTKVTPKEFMEVLNAYKPEEK